MNVLKAIWSVVDVLLGIAIRADEINDRRKAKKKRRLELLEQLPGAEEQREQQRRSRTPTVILRRPRP